METKETVVEEGTTVAASNSPSSTRENAVTSSEEGAAFELTVGEFLKDVSSRTPIVIESATEPWDAFHTLVQNKILSAPVKGTGGYVGILKVSDLMESVISAIQDREQVEKEHKQKHGGHVKLPKQTSREFLESVCARQHKEADGSSVLTTTFLCRRNPFVPVKTTDQFSTVLRALTTKGIHMVPVMNAEDGVAACVSQSSVIPFLKKHEERLAYLFSKTVHELKLGTSPVISISAKAPAIEAFKMMSLHRISGMAVVDDEGVLIGNISASDIKLFLDVPRAKVMQLPVQEFVNRIRRHTPSAKTRIPVVAVPDSATLRKVIAKFAATRLHRVFVVADQKPQACISLRDILLALLPHA
jgi:CBS domain-containing protein